ncbi:MAG: hypothetical protein LBN36_02405, partial [Clostridiales Family XIII bacterium]|nr:hypothetical protein [Clostridiales Family XIII bacterium]
MAENENEIGSEDEIGNEDEIATEDETETEEEKPAETYTVSYKTGTSGGGVSDMPKPLKEKNKAPGEYTVSGAAPARLNFTFDGWTMSPGDEKKDAGATYQIEDANVTFTAQWKPL